MGIGSGLGGSFGAKKETTYGTYAAPDHFVEVNSAPFTRKPNYVQGGGLAAGQFVKPSNRQTLTHREAEGQVEFEVTNKGFGFLLNQLFGSNPTPTQQGATAAYLQTHTLADTRGTSMTCQVGVPTTDGTVNPYTFLGCKATALELSCGAGELLIARLSLDAADYTELQTLSAPSFPSSTKPFNFSQMTVKLGTVGAEASVSGVRKVTLRVERPHKTDRQYAGNAGVKAEPLVNDWANITGSIETDFATKADWADRVPVATSTSLIWTFQGALIASTYYDTLTFTLPATFIESGDPQLEGPDVIAPTFNFRALDNGTNEPITVAYTSTDITL